jgi:hypothetical protein
MNSTTKLIASVAALIASLTLLWTAYSLIEGRVQLHLSHVVTVTVVPHQITYLQPDLRIGIEHEP